MTKLALIRTIYKRQIKSSKTRNMALPEFSYKEFKDWIMSQDIFHSIYLEWIHFNKDIDYKPSVDRLKNDIGYRFDNMQVVNWRYNRYKQYCENAKNLSLRCFEVKENLKNKYGFI